MGLVLGVLLWRNGHDSESPAWGSEFQPSEGKLAPKDTAISAHAHPQTATALEIGRSSGDAPDVASPESRKLYRSNMEPLAEDFIPSHEFVGPDSGSQLPSLSQPFVESSTIVGENANGGMPSLHDTFVPSDHFVGTNAYMYRNIEYSGTEERSGKTFTSKPDSMYSNQKQEDFQDVMELPSAAE